MFEVDPKARKRLAKLQDDLTTFAKRAVPIAVRNSLNTTAFEARRVWVGELKQRMVLRNTWTERSLRVEKAAGYDLDSMESKVGSILPYVATREQGGTEAKKGKHGVALPTSSAAGQGMKTWPRTRQVQRRHWMSSIRLADRPGAGRKQRNAIAIARAIKNKSKDVVFLDLGRRQGLFRVTGTRRGLKVRMIWDLSKSSVRTAPIPTLAPALEALRPRLPAIHEKALLEQLKRNRVLWYGVW